MLNQRVDMKEMAQIALNCYGGQYLVVIIL